MGSGAAAAHLDTAPEKRWETERGCVRSTSRSDWRERHIEERDKSSVDGVDSDL